VKLVIIKPHISEPRFQFDRTIELSKYMEVKWICGWMLHSRYSFSDYEYENHKIIVLGSGLVKGGVIGLMDELIFSVKAMNEIRNESPDLVLVHYSRG